MLKKHIFLYILTKLKNKQWYELFRGGTKLYQNSRPNT